MAKFCAILRSLFGLVCADDGDKKISQSEYDLFTCKNCHAESFCANGHNYMNNLRDLEQRLFE